MQLLNLGDVRTEVNRRLQDLFEAKQKRARPELVQATSELVLRPEAGKRLRPYLMYLAYKGYGGNDDTVVLDIATALELIHQALLIHDDIIDRDTLRYGGPNLTGKYEQTYASCGEKDATHFAEGAALLAGDLLQAYATEVVSGSGATAEQRVAALQRMQLAIQAVIGGELLDMEAPLLGAVPTEASVLEIARDKTASYSCVLPLRLGAELAGANQTELACMRTMGEAAGIAFQIADDVLGVFGDTVTTGKPVTSDLAEGKHTLLIAYGLELATPAQLATLRAEWGNRKVTPAGLAAVKELLEDCGARSKAEQQADHFATRAHVALADCGLSSSVRDHLEGLFRSFAKRQK